MSEEEFRHVGLNLGATDDIDARARRERAVFGFWVFLMSDAVIFALLFATYGVCCQRHRGRPDTGRRIQDRARLARNTAPAHQQLHLRHGVGRDEARQAGQSLACCSAGWP